MYNCCSMPKDALADRNIVIAEAEIQHYVLNIGHKFPSNLRARFEIAHIFARMKLNPACIPHSTRGVKSNVTTHLSKASRDLWHLLSSEKFWLWWDFSLSSGSADHFWQEQDSGDYELRHVVAFGRNLPLYVWQQGQPASNSISLCHASYWMCHLCQPARPVRCTGAFNLLQSNRDNL